MKNARHHWAVRMLQEWGTDPRRAGAARPLDREVDARYLQGAFIPRADDRARAEAQVTRAEAERAAALG